MIKILCLGNEFIKEDSLAKRIGSELNLEDTDVTFIKDSFQLMELLNNFKEEDEIIILDVVLGLKEVKLLSVDDLKSEGIITAHDFDAGFILKLLDKKQKIKIIGIPMKGNISKIKKQVKKYLKII
jgi:hydrogenase maturation protease